MNGSEPKQILAGWVIDGSGGPIKKRVLLTVTGGRISSVEEDFTGELEAGCTDLSFATLVPPFVDSHVHLAMSGGVEPELRSSQLQSGCDQLTPVIERHLHYLFSHGVLAIRDGGDRGGCVASFTEDYTGPVHISTPGPAWYRKGRYGGLIGRSLEAGEDAGEAFQASAAVFDHVKLVNSGLNSLKQYGWTSLPQFDRDEVSRLVEAARSRDCKVMVHANGTEPVREAVEGGCHSIEHGFFMGDDNLRRMAEYGVVWVPTAVTMKMYAEVLEVQGDREGAEVARRNLAHQLEQIARAWDLGVEIALGTDSGSSGVLHGESLVEEMKLLVKAGLPLVGAIRSATAVGADLLGIEDWGVIEQGKRADFLVARGAPSQLPRKFSYLEDIYTAGEPSVWYRKNPFKHVV